MIDRPCTSKDVELQQLGNCYKKNFQKPKWLWWLTTLAVSMDSVGLKRKAMYNFFAITLDLFI